MFSLFWKHCSFGAALLTILLLQNDQILSPLPIPVQLLFLSPASGKQKPQLSQDDISGLCEPSTPSPLYLHPTPTFRAIIWPPTLRQASFSVMGSKSSLQRWIALLCRFNWRPLTGEGRAFSGRGHHAVTWLQGSLHPLFKKHLTRRIAGWLPPLLCWGPTRSLTKHQFVECHISFLQYSIWTEYVLKSALSSRLTCTLALTQENHMCYLASCYTNTSIFWTFHFVSWKFMLHGVMVSIQTALQHRVGKLGLQTGVIKFPAWLRTSAQDKCLILSAWARN